MISRVNAPQPEKPISEQSFNKTRTTLYISYIYIYPIVRRIIPPPPPPSHFVELCIRNTETAGKHIGHAFLNVYIRSTVSSSVQYSLDNVRDVAQ